MIEARERAAGGRPYGRVLFTRLELEWLRPHPPLELLDPAVTWVPAGEDNFGVVDRHWLAPRAAAARLMGQWDALVDGSAVEVVHGHGSGGGHVALARVTPRFVSSEIYLERTLSFYGLRVGRFPMVAFLQCCEESYLDAQGRGIRSEHWGVLSTGVGAARGAKTCFQAHCNKKRCPRAAPLWRAQREPGMCAFKYDDEGSSAVINAEILALPHARLRPAADPPMRLEITLDVSTEAGVRVAPFFFCMRCNAQHALTPATNLTAGCLFRAGYTYSDQLVARAAREHNCRYFDSVGMEQLCASFTRPGDEPDHRGTTYAESTIRGGVGGTRSSRTALLLSIRWPAASTVRSSEDVSRGARPAGREPPQLLCRGLGQSEARREGPWPLRPRQGSDGASARDEPRSAQPRGGPASCPVRASCHHRQGQQPRRCAACAASGAPQRTERRPGSPGARPCSPDDGRTSRCVARPTAAPRARRLARALPPTISSFRVRYRGNRYLEVERRPRLRPPAPPLAPPPPAQTASAISSDASEEGVRARYGLVGRRSHCRLAAPASRRRQRRSR